jgi:hypothetical protein
LSDWVDRLIAKPVGVPLPHAIPGTSTHVHVSSGTPKLASTDGDDEELPQATSMPNHRARILILIQK